MVKSIEQLKREVAAERSKPRPGSGNYKRKPEQGEKIKQKHLQRVAEGVHNRAIKGQCYFCGFIGQKLMVDRWHNDNCRHKKEQEKNTWQYISPKLRGLKVR